MFSLPILIAIFCVIFAYVLFLLTKQKNSRICFVGPHSTGKTISLLSLLGAENKTVTTLVDHRIFYKNREIFEIVPNDKTNDFPEKYQLNSNDKFVFFVKNEEEVESFPDCSDFNITFVMWKKTEEKKRKDIVYLEESREKLKNLVLNI